MFVIELVSILPIDVDGSVTDGIASYMGVWAVFTIIKGGAAGESDANAIPVFD